MDQFLASLPRSVVAVGAILIGFLLIMLFDPPRTVCDTQMEIFREAQKKFLFASTKNDITLPAEIDGLTARCQQSNGPGGCFELFSKLKKLVTDLEDIPDSCSADAAGVAEIRKWLWKSIEIMVQAAWGEKPPTTYNQRNGWLDTSDIVLFCALQKQTKELYGEDAFREFREKVSAQLPGANTLVPEHLWQRSIFSTKCDAYR